MNRNYKNCPVHVYILLLNDGTYYCGITNNMDRRLKEHNEGKSKYTSRSIPVKLVYTETQKTRTLARKREVQIKGRGVKRYYLTTLYR
ncbi:MAG: GIY-YIG nuclease family protein [Nitrosomonadaceae bacterium]